MKYTLEQIEEAIERLTDMDVSEFVNARRERRYTVPRKAMFFITTPLLAPAPLLAPSMSTMHEYLGFSYGKKPQNAKRR